MLGPLLPLLIAAPILLSRDASLDSLKEAGQWRQLRPPHHSALELGGISRRTRALNNIMY